MVAEGGLAGRTCGGEAFGRPIDVRLAVEDEIDLPHGRAFVSDRAPSSRTVPLPPQPLRAALPAFTNKEKNKLFLFPSNT